MESLSIKHSEIQKTLDRDIKNQQENLKKKLQERKEKSMERSMNRSRDHIKPKQDNQDNFQELENPFK